MPKLRKQTQTHPVEITDSALESALRESLKPLYQEIETLKEQLRISNETQINSQEKLLELLRLLKTFIELLGDNKK